MAGAVNIFPLETIGAVTVVFDVSFLLLVVMGAFVVVPLIGAISLGIWCKGMNVRTAPLVRRWLAYVAAFVAALLVVSLMMFLVKDIAKVPGWFLVMLFFQAIAVHAVVVPWALRSEWGKQISAQAMTLAVHGAVLVVAMAPVIIHVRGAVDRGEWTADLESLYNAVTLGKGMAAEELPETLLAAENAGKTIILLPGHKRSEIVYLGDYVHANYPSTLTERFVVSMSEFKDKNPETWPLLWRNPKSTRKRRIPVCSYAGDVTFVTREEFYRHLDLMLLELDRIELDGSDHGSERDQ